MFDYYYEEKKNYEIYFDQIHSIKGKSIIILYFKRYY